MADSEPVEELAPAEQEAAAEPEPAPQPAEAVEAPAADGPAADEPAAEVAAAEETSAEMPAEAPAEAEPERAAEAPAAQPADEEPSHNPALLAWVRGRVSLAGVTAQSWTSEHEGAVAEFLASPTQRRLLAFVDPVLGLSLTTSLPQVRSLDSKNGTHT